MFFIRLDDKMLIIIKKSIVIFYTCQKTYFKTCGVVGMIERILGSILFWGEIKWDCAISKYFMA